MSINGVIESKLRFLEQILSDLESWPLGDLADFAHNSMVRRAVERAMQLGVESMIDISERILAAKRLPPADTAAENFRRLQELGFIKDPERYIAMVRFRNFIVHRYEQIDPEIVYDLARHKLDRCRQFVDEIRRACARGGM